MVLDAFGVSLSHTTVWRDLQEKADLLDQQRRWQKLRVFGFDGAYPLGWGKKQLVLVAIDMGNGQPVALAQVDESNPQAMRRFLEPLVMRLGVSAITIQKILNCNEMGSR
jgi:hypothetical protein